MKKMTKRKLIDCSLGDYIIWRDSRAVRFRNHQTDKKMIRKFSPLIAWARVPEKDVYDDANKSSLCYWYEVEKVIQHEIDSLIQKEKLCIGDFERGLYVFAIDRLRKVLREIADE